MCGLYIHVPFCEKKCGYCSFYSVAVGQNPSVASRHLPLTGEASEVFPRPPCQGGIPASAGGGALLDEFLAALELEAKKFAASFSKKAKIRTLYFGGGTPTVLNISQWEKLLRIIEKNFDVSDAIEISTEANPSSLTREHIKFFLANNFSRISLGVQSLNNNELKILGRVHDADKALYSMELVKNSGLKLSCDLIFAIPEQNLRTWDFSLKKIIEYASHISVYQLTLEPDVPMAKKFPDKNLLNESGYKFYRYAQYLLPKKNFAQYEISSFAKNSCECRHNISYWRQENVIALGPSAVSYLNGVRTKNPVTLEKYFEAARKNFPQEFYEHEELSPREKLIEYIILSLRTKWGVEISILPPEVKKILSQMPQDLFIRTEKNISLSPRGMRLGNAIWAELIDL